MNAEQLRAMQAPVKARYKENPSSALVTLHAQGTLDTEKITCKLETPRGPIEAGLHPATGGDGQSACSGDMPLEARSTLSPARRRRTTARPLAEIVAAFIR